MADIDDQQNLPPSRHPIPSQPQHTRILTTIPPSLTLPSYDPDHKLSYPPSTREAIETTNWLFFQNAGVGPMQGQASTSHHSIPIPSLSSTPI